MFFFIIILISFTEFLIVNLILAMNYLGFNYANGNGFEKNLKKSKDLYEKAANLGNARGIKTKKIFLDKFFIFFSNV